MNTLNINNDLIDERLERLENLYNHIEQLEKERDLINIEEDNESKEEEEKNKKFEHLFKQKLYTRIEQIINENEEEEDEEYEQDFIDIETEDEEEEEVKGDPTKMNETLTNDYNKWIESTKRFYGITEDKKELIKYLLPYFNNIHCKDFLLKIINQYICNHTIEKLLREFIGIDERQKRHRNLCIRERHSFRQLDGFFDYSELNIIECTNCANNGNENLCLHNI